MDSRSRWFPWSKAASGLITVVALSLWVCGRSLRHMAHVRQPPATRLEVRDFVRGLDDDAEPEVREKYLIFRLNLGYGWGDNIRGLLHAHALGAIHDRRLLVDWKDPSHGLNLGQEFGFRHFVPRHVAWNMTTVPSEYVQSEPRGAVSLASRPRDCVAAKAAPVNADEVRRLVKEIADNELGDHVLTMYPGFSWAFASVIAEQSKNVVVQYHGMMAPNTILESFEENDHVNAIMTSIRPTWSSLRYFVSRARKAKPWVRLNGFNELFQMSRELSVYMDRALSRTVLLIDPEDDAWTPDKADLGAAQLRVLSAVNDLTAEQRKDLFSKLALGLTDFMRLGPFAHCRSSGLSQAFSDRLAAVRFKDERLEQVRHKLLQIFPADWRLIGIHFREGDRYSTLHLVGDFRKKREDVSSEVNHDAVYGLLLLDRPR